MRIINDEAFQSYLATFDGVKPSYTDTVEMSTAKYPFGDYILKGNLYLAKIKLLRITISPFKKNNDYWRFGIRFTDELPLGRPHRMAEGHPLFHLTRNTDPTSVLGTTYYDEHGKYVEENSGVVLQDYKNSPVEIVVYQKEALLAIAVLFETRHVWSNTFDFYTHQIAQLAAWGDANNYRLKVKVLGYAS